MAEQFVGKISEFKDGDRRIIFVGDNEIGVFRHEGQFFAYSNFCLHQGGPACEGLTIAKVADGRAEVLTPAALQALMAAACKAYAAQVEAGKEIAALSARTTVTPTEVMVTASGLLRAANLAVFELGMWQSWTGR